MESVFHLVHWEPYLFAGHRPGESRGPASQGPCQDCVSCRTSVDSIASFELSALAHILEVRGSLECSEIAIERSLHQQL